MKYPPKSVKATQKKGGRKMKRVLTAVALSAFIGLAGCKGEPTVLLEETTVVPQDGYVYYTLSLNEGDEVETEVRVQNDQPIDILLIDKSDLDAWEDTSNIIFISYYFCCSTFGIKNETYTFTVPKTGEFVMILNNGWRTFGESFPSEKDADVYVKMTAK